MAYVLHTTFSNEFSLIKTVVFWLKFHSSCSQRFNWHVIIGLGNGQAPSSWWAITLTYDEPVYWHIYAYPGLNVFTKLTKYPETEMAKR